MSVAAGFAPGLGRGEALGALAARLGAAGIENPKREARSLLRAAGISSLDLLGAPDAPLAAAQAARLAAMAERRAAHEPLARILGRREFWSLELAISPAVLDPRPDTETIVEAALKAFAGRREEALRILDLGTGSGALLCALLSEFPRATGLGIDISPAAVAVARENLARCGLAARGEARVGDWGAGLEGPFDLIVSNPPYIPSGDIAGLERGVRDYDPALALDGGGDGLTAYRALMPEIARLLAGNGGRFFVEIGVGQAERVNMIAARNGLGQLSEKVDFAGHSRVVGGGTASP